MDGEEDEAAEPGDGEYDVADPPRNDLSVVEGVMSRREAVVGLLVLLVLLLYLALMSETRRCGAVSIPSSLSSSSAWLMVVVWWFASAGCTLKV